MAADGGEAWGWVGEWRWGRVEGGEGWREGKGGGRGEGEGRGDAVEGRDWRVEGGGCWWELGDGRGREVVGEGGGKRKVEEDGRGRREKEGGGRWEKVGGGRWWKGKFEGCERWLWAVKGGRWRKGKGGKGNVLSEEAERERWWRVESMENDGK